MEELLKAYELEAVQLKLLSSEFAKRFPKVAGKLQMAKVDPSVKTGMYLV